MTRCCCCRDRSCGLSSGMLSFVGIRGYMPERQRREDWRELTVEITAHCSSTNTVQMTWHCSASRDTRL